MKQPSPYAALLHRAGFKATPGRAAFLAILEKAAKPLSIQDIQAKLKRTDLATIYRMVKAFEDKGLVRQVDFQHGHAHYELSIKGHHHHLICERCGKIVDISEADLSALSLVEKRALILGGFAKINRHSLEFFGLCRSCARARR